MQIKDVCLECGLTKKAVAYYEQQGLVQPYILENGYRDYSEKDVLRFKEIAVLRHCGMGIPQIKTVVNGKNKEVILAKYNYLAGLKLEEAKRVQQLLEGLVEHYDIEQAFEQICETGRAGMTIKEKLVFAFPGTYGIYLALHFGKFLDVAIDSEEKMQVYAQMVEYLDSVKMEIPPELDALLEETFQLLKQADMEQMQVELQKAIEDVETYVEDRKELLNAYVEVQASEEFKLSPAYKMSNLMVEFQQSSGYSEKFLNNLMVLSPAYKKYVDKVHAANQKLLEKYPQFKQL